MAVGLSTLGATQAYSTGTALASASVTPTVGRFLAVHVTVSGGSSATASLTTGSIATTTGGTWSWTLQQAAPNVAAAVAHYVFYAFVPSGASTGTFTVTAAATVTHARISITEATGVDTTTPVAGVTSVTNSAATSQSLTVGATPTTGDALFGSFGVRNDTSGMTVGTSFTALFNEFGSSPSASQLIEYRTGTTSTTVDMSNAAATSTSGVAFVIKESSSVGATVNAPAGAVTYAGSTPSVTAASVVAAALASVAFLGLAPAVTAGARIEPPAATASFAGQAPSVAGGARVEPPTGVLTFTGPAPALTAGSSVAAPAGALTITGLTPTVTAGARVEAPAGALTFTGQTPLVGQVLAPPPAPERTYTITGARTFLIPTAGRTYTIPATDRTR